MKELPITQSAYAKRAKVSQPRIFKMIQTGIITRSALIKSGKRWKIWPSKADQDIKDNRDRTMIRGGIKKSGKKSKGAVVDDVDLQEKERVVGEAGLKDIVSFNQLRAIGEQYKTGLLKIKYEVEQGKWLWAEDVERMCFAAGLQFKEASKAMIERVAPILAAESDPFKVKEVLIKENQNMLQDLSDALIRAGERAK